MIIVDERRIAPDEDPVCAMQVEADAARLLGLLLVRDDRTFVFCSAGCRQAFHDDPAWFLDPAYTPAHR